VSRPVEKTGRLFYFFPLRNIFFQLCPVEKTKRNMTRQDIQGLDARYQRKVEGLFQALSQKNDELLNRKPADGGWSAIQTMHHLILSEELAYSYVQKKLGFNAEFDSVGPSTYWRGFLLWAFLVSPVKAKAPPGVAAEKLPDFATLSDTRDRWLKTRADWTAFFETVPENLLNKAVYKHPRAGKLGWRQMFGFLNAHFNRHDGQIQRAIR
jgi:hypothetical protein